MITRVLLSLVIVFSATLAFGQIYRWTDEQGGIHYTDDYDKIPERYRSNIRKMEEDRGSEPDKKEAGGPLKGAISPSKDRLGRDETYWKGRAEELKNKMKALQEKNERLRIRYNDLTVKHNESKSSAERGSLRVEREQVKLEMDQNKAEIEETKIMLEKKLQEEAELFGAKPEWVK